MKNGGYKIISLKNINLEKKQGFTGTLKKVFSNIENNFRKPLLFTDIVIDGVEKADVFAEAILQGQAGNQGFIIKLYDLYILITDQEEDNLHILDGAGYVSLNATTGKNSQYLGFLDKFAFVDNEDPTLGVVVLRFSYTDNSNNIYFKGETETKKYTLKLETSGNYTITKI